MKNILKFLNALKDNNNRDWFNEHKDWYKESQSGYSSQVEKVLFGISGFDPRLLGLPVKDTLFRIYKDIRFSKDKTPYKEHFGAYMSPGGRKSEGAGYYFHLEPGNVFIAGGIYMPSREHLQVIRQEIMFRADEYMKIVRDPSLKAAGFIRSGLDDQLKKGPAGFPKDFKYLDEIKPRHYIFSKGYSDEEALEEDFTDHVVSDYRKLFPYVHFLSTALEFTGNE